jgi:hypothetical protein
MNKDKKCKICKKPLIGEMIFHSDLCLSCVIDYHSKGELNKLKKYEKK